MYLCVGLYATGMGQIQNLNQSNIMKMSMLGPSTDPSDYDSVKLHCVTKNYKNNTVVLLQSC